MTDKYGAEAETHEPGTEHDPAATTEWHGDQPPVDDFADADHAATEGAASVSEEAEVEQMVDESVNPPKKSSFLGILIVLLGLIGAGAAVYYQFFGGAALLKPATPVAQAHKSLPQQMPPALQQAAAVPPAPSTPSDINNLKPASAPSPAVAMPSPSGSVPSDIAMPSAMPQLQPPSAAIPSPMVEPAIPAATGSLEMQLNSLSNRVESLQKSIDQLNGMVTALQSAPAVPPTVSAMEDRLNKIEQDVMKLEQTTPPAMAKPLPVPAAALKPVHSAKPKETRTVAKAAKSAPRPAAKPAPVVISALPPAPAAVSWVLRAATPGEAWVSQGASSSELRHIQVGDDLSGIGHITAIRQNGGRWMIEGTKGTLQ